MVPVSNYLVSFGDNYCIGALTKQGFFPTETPYTIWPPVIGQPHRLARLPGHVRRHQRESAPNGGSWLPPRDVRLYNESARDNRQRHRWDKQHDRGW